MRDENLKNAMTSLVKVLRELLANMEQEQQAIFQQNSSTFQVIMQQRDSLIKWMNDHRNTMIKQIEKLKDSHQVFPEMETDRDILMHLMLIVGEDDVELLTLRDQILALMEKMEKQNVSINSLLGNRMPETPLEKVNFTHQYKPIKRRLQPKKATTPQKKILVKTLELNSEEK
jgi:flagellar biosynthesis/type III secretory pathway chaperone